jgi:circadian clock protein KaiB
VSERRYGLTLFVTGVTPRSMRAVANVRSYCDQHLANDYDLEIVDLYEHPERAQPAQVVVSPTLVRHEPKPVRLLIGDMSDLGRLAATIKAEQPN